MRLVWIDPHADDDPFPDVSTALKEPDGLLAVGGHLDPDLLLTAYRRGIFPWYSEGQPVLWWSPDPRAVIFPDKVRISRSLDRSLKKKPYQTTINQAFDAVIQACALPRPNQEGTWITADMAKAYSRLASLGHAHSIETWSDGKLVGGLYGVAIGCVFFGESMFSFASDASKVALVRLADELCQRGYRLIDCQVQSQHLDSLGAIALQRQHFIELISHWCNRAPMSPLSNEVRYAP